MSAATSRACVPSTWRASEYDVEGKFLLDASGFGRVLPKLLDLETPSPLRTA